VDVDNSSWRPGSSASSLNEMVIDCSRSRGKCAPFGRRSAARTLLPGQGNLLLARREAYDLRLVESRPNRSMVVKSVTVTAIGCAPSPTVRRITEVMASPTRHRQRTASNAFCRCARRYGHESRSVRARSCSRALVCAGKRPSVRSPGLEAARRLVMDADNDVSVAPARQQREARAGPPRYGVCWKSPTCEYAVLRAEKAASRLMQ
jgi:hypothetical protein